MICASLLAYADDHRYLDRIHILCPVRTALTDPFS